MENRCDGSGRDDGPRVRFLLGPAGSGKTHECLAEVAAALKREPDGPPLLFLAPKQATYQLEQRLLEDPAVGGWTRLQMLSFERLARMAMDERSRGRVVDEEGRVMVLRALLRWHEGRLRVFRSAARLTGFAQELSGTLRELQRYQLGPERLLELADRAGAEGGGGGRALSDKLRDLALIARAYREWLGERGLFDGELLLELAATKLSEDGGASFEGVWLDGFAEMTPQEIEVLAAVVRRSRRSTLAFCLDDDVREELPWLSTWSVVNQTVRRCWTRIAALPGVQAERALLRRRSLVGRFAGSPALAHIERAWSAPSKAEGEACDGAPSALELVACADFEGEVEHAAREIWRHVLGGGRFKDVAVIVRSLDREPEVLQRVFWRYEIPVFIDRREPLAHHPLAELTRSAVRLAAFGWSHEDWFGALKTGMAQVSPDWVDEIENRALAGGWIGAQWLEAEERIPWGSEVERRAGEKLVGPFREMMRLIERGCDARELCGAIRGLWVALDVESTLTEWDTETGRLGMGGLGGSVPVHRTAHEQLTAWLASVEQAFETVRLPLAEWLPLIEAGLATLSAGAIPAAQDQVLVGAVDRSRQPELRQVFVLGMNDGIFPAPPSGTGVLTERERERLAEHGVMLPPGRRARVGQERYLGYIACTRARERVVLSWSERDAAGTRLTPSPFIEGVRRMFPDMEVRGGDRGAPSSMAPIEELAKGVVHASELLPWLLAQKEETEVEALAVDGMRRAWLRRWREAGSEERLEEWAVRGLYGEEPEVSVTGLEDFAACAFRFTVRHGLRGEERERFEVDRRRSGSLAHALLARFHERAVAGGRRWRDWDAESAQRLFDDVASATVSTFDGGVFGATPEGRWESEGVVRGVRELVGELVAWMGRYEFDPVRVEVAFGGSGELPGWRMDVGAGGALRVRGKVDRLDVCQGGDGAPWYAVMDYKLRAKPLNERAVMAGLDLQLAVYALAMSRVVPWEKFGVKGPARPAGFFYVPLLAKEERAESRGELFQVEVTKRSMHEHAGRLRLGARQWFDNRRSGVVGGQFAIRINQDGTPRRGGGVLTDSGFDGLLHGVEEAVVEIGAAILRGEASVRPVRLGARVACDTCDLQSVCRFDAATQAYRKAGEGRRSWEDVGNSR